MPLKKIAKPDGTSWWIRKAYDPKDYTVPKAELDGLRALSKWGMGSQDELDLHDRAFASYTFVRRVERDGKTFVVLKHSGEWLIEVELTRGKTGELNAIPPADAWRLAREGDTGDPGPPIDFEGSHRPDRPLERPLHGGRAPAGRRHRRAWRLPRLRHLGVSQTRAQRRSPTRSKLHG